MSRSYKVEYVSGIAVNYVVYPDVETTFVCEAKSKADAVIFCVNLNTVYTIKSVEKVKSNE